MKGVRWLFYSAQCLMLVSFAIQADQHHGELPGLMVSGVEDELETNIRRSIHPQRYRCQDEDWQLKRLQSRAERDADRALQALGYYHSQIQAAIARQADCWDLQIEVQAGEQVKLATVEIDIKGALKDLPAMQSFLRAPPVAPGQGLNHDRYAQTKAGIARLAARYGFFDGKFVRNTLDIDPPRGRADISLVFRSGPRSHLGEIQFEQDLFDPALMAQYQILHPGQPYDRTELARQQQLLVSSGYFASVRVIADHDQRQADERIPVRIELEAVKQHAYQFGLGASTDTGARVSFGLNNRRLNARGHQYGFDSQLSQKRQEVTFDYGIPRGKAGAERVDFQLGYQYENLETFEEESLQFAVLNTDTYDSGWVRTLFIEYLNEDFVVANVPGSGELLMPGIRYRKTTANEPFYPTRGWRLEAALRIAGDAVLSSTDFAQITFAHKRILPLFSGRLLARVNLGASLVGDFDQLPASKRFFAGGDNSVRGFDYKTLGPLDENGEVPGGEHLITASFEYEHKIKANWGMAVFIDSGNAFNRIDELDLYTGAGVGLRWYSPVGPIRLDAARDVSGEQSARLHLSMGLDL